MTCRLSNKPRRRSVIDRWYESSRPNRSPSEALNSNSNTRLPKTTTSKPDSTSLLDIAHHSNEKYYSTSHRDHHPPHWLSNISPTTIASGIETLKLIFTRYILDTQSILSLFTSSLRPIVESTTSSYRHFSGRRLDGSSCASISLDNDGSVRPWTTSSHVKKGKTGFLLQLNTILWQRVCRSWINVWTRTRKTLASGICFRNALISRKIGGQQQELSSDSRENNKQLLNKNIEGIYNDNYNNNYYNNISNHNDNNNNNSACASTSLSSNEFGDGFFDKNMAISATEDGIVKENYTEGRDSVRSQSEKKEGSCMAIIIGLIAGIMWF